MYTKAPREITTNRDEIAAALRQWQQKYRDTPEEFGGSDESCRTDADYLIDLIEAGRS